MSPWKKTNCSSSASTTSTPHWTNTTHCRLKQWFKINIKTPNLRSFGTYGKMTRNCQMWMILFNIWKTIMVKTTIKRRSHLIEGLNNWNIKGIYRIREMRMKFKWLWWKTKSTNHRSGEIKTQITEQYKSKRHLTGSKSRQSNSSIPKRAKSRCSEAQIPTSLA